MFLGCHLSSTKGFLAMGLEAQRLGANTFQFFSRNPRGGAVKALDLADLKALVDFMSENGFGPVLAHAPYTLNPCSAEAKTRQFAFLAMSEDLARLRHFPGAMFNFHPGSHTGQGVEIGIGLTVELLNEVLTKDNPTMVLLETMAGKGSELGRTFGELAEIIGKVDLDQQVGVCFDTCHVFDGGYDIKNDPDGVLKEFDAKIGLSKLKAVHINDSLNGLSSHKDRHAKIGQGQIGLEALKRLLCHEKLKNLPFILETPNDSEGYALEIKLLKDLNL
jgi:deoxyribonuclease-4